MPVDTPPTDPLSLNVGVVRPFDRRFAALDLLSAEFGSADGSEDSAAADKGVARPTPAPRSAVWEVACSFAYSACCSHPQRPSMSARVHAEPLCSRYDGRFGRLHAQP